jgi:hypothetical protein
MIGNQWFLSIKSKAQWTSKILPIQAYYSFKNNNNEWSKKKSHLYDHFNKFIWEENKPINQGNWIILE